MRLIYEASNALEAQMILNLLEQAGLSARIDGEYLQGGIGELQAIGVVRVLVREEDFTEAKAIIAEWESREVLIEEPKPEPGMGSRLAVGLLGLVVGVACSFVYYNTPVTEDGIDYNGDGILDDKWTYVNYRISKAEVDRDFDGEIDLLISYDRLGLIESASSDDDFDGVFETDTYYKNGNPAVLRADTTGDGFREYWVTYKHGMADKVSFLNPDTRKVVKEQYFGAHRLMRAKLDTSGDGVLDTLIEYDAIEEVAGRSGQQSRQ